MKATGNLKCMQKKNNFKLSSKTKAIFQNKITILVFDVVSPEYEQLFIQHVNYRRLVDALLIGC